MIRQGVEKPNFSKEMREQESKPQASAAAMQRRMTVTGMNFGKQAKMEGAMNSTKGFGFDVGDPSTKKLKEQIKIMEAKNAELEEQIVKLRYSLQENVGESEAVLELQKQLDIKEMQIKDRDDEIQQII